MDSDVCSGLLHLCRATQTISSTRLFKPVVTFTISLLFFHFFPSPPPPSLISPSPDLSYYFLPPLPPAFLFHVQVNCVSFNPFSEYILATGSADRVSLTLIQTSHPEGNSLYGREFLIWEAILYMGGNSLYGKKFLIWEEIPYMGGNSLYGRKFLIWEQ